MITSEQAGSLLSKWGKSIKKWGSEGEDLIAIMTAIHTNTPYVNKQYDSNPAATPTPDRALHDWMLKHKSSTSSDIVSFLNDVKQQNPYTEPSSSQIVNTKNLITISSQLLYPYWFNLAEKKYKDAEKGAKNAKEVAKWAEKGAFARNTVIHLFRADENSKWSIIALPENDRFAPDADVGDPNKFEQRYFKFLSGAPGIEFEEVTSPEITAQNAFEALRQCYPEKNQDVPDFSKELLTKQFKSCFTQRKKPDFGDGIDRREILPPEMLASEERALKAINDSNISVIDPEMLASEERALKAINDSNISVIDDEDPPTVTELKDKHNVVFGKEVVFGQTTFNLRVVGDEIIVFAATNGFNSLHGGMLRLSNNASDSDMEKQISNAWLMQQAAIRLGTQYNPHTKDQPPYEINTNLPVSKICAEAKDLLKQRLAQKLSIEAQLPKDSTDNVGSEPSLNVTVPTPTPAPTPTPTPAPAPAPAPAQKVQQTHTEPSSSQIVNTKNLITISSQLLYPFWFDLAEKKYKDGKEEDAKWAKKGAFARNTVIHLFRADEKSKWSIIALPENDRFAPDAKVGKPNEFEQRYFKFLSGAPGIEFEEGTSPEITAQNAFEALLKCYPVNNQNVPNHSKKLLKEQFKSCFTQRAKTDFGDGIDRREILPPEMLASEERARKTLKDGKISVIDDKKPIQVTKLDVNNHTKVVFGETTFNLRVVGDEIIVFADTKKFPDTKNYNSLHGGMLRLSNNASDWESQISDAWLMQQAAIRLGTQYNPHTKNEPPYTINTNLPVSQICKVAKALLAPHKGLLFDKLQSIYKYGENGGSRMHFNKVNTNGLKDEVKGKYVDKNYEPLIGDGLKRAILDNFKGQLELCKNEIEVNECVETLRKTGEFTILATHQRPQTFKLTESKTSAIQALETMCSQAKNLLNPNAKQDLKNDNENDNENEKKSSMSFNR